MSVQPLLPMNPWANNLAQRAGHTAREGMHHSKIDAGHYLTGFSFAEHFEEPARRFNSHLMLNPSTVYEVVRRSQPTTAILPQVVDHYTPAAVRMYNIATAMAEERQRLRPERYGALLIQEDFFVGVMLSGSEPVEELQGLYGIEPITTFRQLNIKLAPTVLDMMVRN